MTRAHAAHMQDLFYPITMHLFYPLPSHTSLQLPAQLCHLKRNWVGVTKSLPRRAREQELLHVEPTHQLQVCVLDERTLAGHDGASPPATGQRTAVPVNKRTQLRACCAFNT